MNGKLFENGPQSLRFGDSSYRVYYLPETDSTNLRLRAWREGTAPEGVTEALAHGACLAAGAQSRGRGRLGRSFVSPAGGLYFSLYLRAGDAEGALETTPAAACAVCTALEDLGFADPGIKWVNDIYLNGKKVCGILCEGIGDSVICGIGINMTEPPGGFPPEAGPAGALGRPDLEKEELLRRVLEKLAYYTKKENRAALLRDYRERQILTGKRVRCQVGSREVRGRVYGVGDDFSLILAGEEGRKERLSSGEVTRVFPDGEAEEGGKPVCLRAAFFDFDGTLRPGDSVVSFLLYARKRGLLPMGALVRTAADALLGKLGLRTMEQVKTRALAFEKRLSAADRERLARDFVTERLLPELYPAGKAEWRRLKGEGCRMVLVSASTEDYMAPLAAALGADDLLCTPVDPAGTVGPNCRGAEKERRIRRWEQGLPGGVRVDWENSLGYGDSAGDEAMLCLTGHPHAVNPGRRLRGKALRRGWPCLRWRRAQGAP